MPTKVTTPAGQAATLRDTTAPSQDGRVWEVHLIERDIRFTVTLTGREANSTPRGAAPLDRPLTAAEVDYAVLRAIDDALGSPPPKLAGLRYWVNVSAFDLYRAAGVVV
jgi:hypothetical protein